MQRPKSISARAAGGERDHAAGGREAGMEGGSMNPAKMQNNKITEKVLIQVSKLCFVDDLQIWKNGTETTVVRSLSFW
jgi:hypothetical protein